MVNITIAKWIFRNSRTLISDLQEKHKVRWCNEERKKRKGGGKNKYRHNYSALWSSKFPTLYYGVNKKVTNI